jgi:hypothetical protein
VGRVIPAPIGLLALTVAVVAWLHWRRPQEQPPPQTSAYGNARALLQQLPVEGWDSRRDFARYRFGEPWSDDVSVEFGRNGCNIRDDILRRDLTELVARPGTSVAVHVDHVVSLSDAWYTGAHDWDEQRRRDFANDPRNLLAVGGKANFDKAFRDGRLVAPERGFPMRVRCAPGRGESGLPAVGLSEREAGNAVVLDAC